MLWPANYRWIESIGREIFCQDPDDLFNIFLPLLLALVDLIEEVLIDIWIQIFQCQVL